jgi:hypothetical protein
MKQTKSQAAKILRFLEKRRVITLPQARTMFDCERLSARICDLRERGHNILTEMMPTKTGKRVAKYRLIELAK